MDEGWMPLPTRPLRYCDPVSFVFEFSFPTYSYTEDMDTCRIFTRMNLCPTFIFAKVQMKQGRIHERTIADGWARAVKQKPLAIQKCDLPTYRPTDQHGKV